MQEILLFTLHFLMENALNAICRSHEVIYRIENAERSQAEEVKYLGIPSVN